MEPDQESTDLEARKWATGLHLSLLLGWFIPLAGFIVPIVIWVIKKDEFPQLDQHGRNAINWMISQVIYAVIAGLLCFILIGIPLAIALGIMVIAFPVIAALKANDGITWRYPLSLSIM